MPKIGANYRLFLIVDAAKLPQPPGAGPGCVDAKDVRLDYDA